MFETVNLHHSYNGSLILQDINMSVNKGEIVSILGPSGCGKTTLLRILAGILKPTSGMLRNFDIDSSYVFQRPRLLPWNTVYENVELVLHDKVAVEKIPILISKVLKMVELTDVTNSYPLKLSGGMKQRVAIARALVLPTGLIFLDEPFQSLDFDLKQRLMKQLLPLWSERNDTVFIVTHDIKVATTMGDTIYLLSNKPSSVVKELENPISRPARFVNNGSGLIEVEKQIYCSLAEN